jgi:hypothetical protein
MPINWETLRIGLTNNFEGVKAMHTPALASSYLGRNVAKTYDDNMRGKATELVTNNKLQTGNKILMQTTLTAGLLAAMTTSDPIALAAAFNMGIQAYWVGAMMTSTYAAMPPGHINMIPPSIILPTSPPPLFVVPVAPGPQEVYVSLLVAAMQAHTATLMGVHMLMMLPPPAPPYPLPFIGVV